MINKKWNTKMLATAAVTIAMSYLLSLIKLYRMPMGGSVTAASMLPLMIFSWLYGVGPGFFAGAAYGLLKFSLSPEIYHIVQVFVDYPLAYAMLGLAGAFRKIDEPYSLPLGILLAGAGRLLCHLLSGIVFFGSYAPASDFISVFWYSFTYNIGYLGVDTMVCAVLGALPPVQKMVKRLV